MQLSHQHHMKSWRTQQLWQLATLIHKVSRRCNIISSTPMPHFPNQVWKKSKPKHTIKILRVQRCRCYNFKVWYFRKETFCQLRHLAINKTENTYAPGQIDEHYIGPTALANNQHYNQHYRTPWGTTDNTVIAMCSTFFLISHSETSCQIKN